MSKKAIWAFDEEMLDDGIADSNLNAAAGEIVKQFLFSQAAERAKLVVHPSEFMHNERASTAMDGGSAGNAGEISHE